MAHVQLLQTIYGWRKSLVEELNSLSRTSKGDVPTIIQKHVPKPPRLVDWTELPEWLQDGNWRIETGYRIPNPSLRACLSSCMYLHNESVNIGSHLLGALVFLALPYLMHDALYLHYSTASAADLAVFAIYCLGTASCFGLSALFHTTMVHSKLWSSIGRQLDFQGIVLLMWSATISLAYYTFYENPLLQKVYWSLVSLLAVTASVLTLTPAFCRTSSGLLRVGVFSLLGASAIICVAHGIMTYGWAGQSARFPMWAIYLTLLFDTIGALFYVTHFPERQWPRRFDIFGSSHQLMHCSIVVAALVWLAGLTVAFENIHGITSL